MKSLHPIQLLRPKPDSAHIGPRILPRSRGVSIVELMIGITIGLFILAGASLVMTSQISDNRRLLLDTQVQQDLRAVTSLIVRDVRRANYYGLAHRKIWPNDLTQATANPYAGLLPATTDGSSSLQYERSLDDQYGQLNIDDNAVGNGERVTIALNATNHTVEMTLGNSSPQAVTDANVLRVTELTFTVSVRDLAAPCGIDCPTRGPAGCPLVQRLRQVNFVMVAEAVNDSRVRRSLRESVRLQNDIVREAAPC